MLQRYDVDSARLGIKRYAIVSPNPSRPVIQYHHSVTLRARASGYYLKPALLPDTLGPDSEPICTILAVSRIQFLRSEKLHIRKSNPLEVACERLKIEVSRPEAVVLESPIYNHSGSQFSEPLQQRRDQETDIPRSCRSTTV